MAELFNMDTLEQGALDALNAGIGLYQAVSGQVQEIQKKITDGYDELVAKGATDSSETVEKLRSSLDLGINGIKDAQTKIEGTLNLKKEEQA